jgi:predicted nuclease with TOPRIM domain
MKSRIAERSQ